MGKFLKANAKVLQFCGLLDRCYPTTKTCSVVVKKTLSSYLASL